MRKDGDETVTDKDLVQCQCPLVTMDFMPCNHGPRLLS